MGARGELEGQAVAVWYEFLLTVVDIYQYRLSLTVFELLSCIQNVFGQAPFRFLPLDEAIAFWSGICHSIWVGRAGGRAETLLEPGK